MAVPKLWSPIVEATVISTLASEDARTLFGTFARSVKRVALDKKASARILKSMHRY